MAEQLCLEVAPSILIDFICAHVSESERHAGYETEREGGKEKESGVAFAGARDEQAGWQAREKE